MNSSSDLGRHEISTRLTANMRILFIDYPNNEDMVQIVKDTTLCTLSNSEKTREIIKNNPRMVESISGYLIELFNFVKQNFIAETKNHYQFSPKDITKILNNMLSYQIEEKQDLLVALDSECNIVFGNRLVGEDEISKYSNMCRKLATKLLGGNLAKNDMVFSSMVTRSSEITKVPKADYI